MCELFEKGPLRKEIEPRTQVYLHLTFLLRCISDNILHAIRQFLYPVADNHLVLIQHRPSECAVPWLPLPGRVGVAGEARCRGWRMQDCCQESFTVAEVA